jgi:hypothetical protein
MWEPQPLTTLRASKACRGENFTFIIIIFIVLGRVWSVHLFVLTVGALHFAVMLSCMLKLSLEFVHLPFTEHDVSTVIWILKFY